MVEAAQQPERARRDKRPMGQPDENAAMPCGHQRIGQAARDNRGLRGLSAREIPGQNPDHQRFPAVRRAFKSLPALELRTRL